MTSHRLAAADAAVRRSNTRASAPAEIGNGPRAPQLSHTRTPAPREIRDSPASHAPTAAPLAAPAAPLDDLGAHDLVRVPAATNEFGIECYVERKQNPDAFLEYAARTEAFRNLLFGLSAEVFDVDLEAVHLYWDRGGRTAAFNLGGSLFFNLASDVDSVPASTSDLASAALHWYGVFCHELTHNVVMQHDATFANYLEVNCVHFCGRLSKFLERRGLSLPT